MLENILSPELVIGIVAPIGVDTPFVIKTLSEALAEYDYNSSHIKITDLMKEIPTGTALLETPIEERYKSRIKYANHVRRLFSKLDTQSNGNNALALLAVQAISASRLKANPEGNSQHGHAYILDQLKRPEEVALLRRIYGRLFIQVSIHATKEARAGALERKIKDSHPETPYKDFKSEAHSLIRQDLEEEEESHGQRVRDAFHLADVIIDGADKDRAQSEVKRFVRLFFGYNFISPVRDEYGMYLAKSAALRSADLSRQVGAAIFSGKGEIISLGSNEVPKAGGGTYFEGDEPDLRDYQFGSDFNEKEKVRILSELVRRIHDLKYLKEIPDCQSLDSLVEHLLSDPNGPKLRDTRIMDLLEFGRQIHAEMSAILDAARLGRSIEGATLFCTTFPCHMCAKLILGAGIKRVVYLEPYPKSFAEDMYPSAIDVESRKTAEDTRILFEPFTGIAPLRYRDLFEKRRRKLPGGNIDEWKGGKPRPNVELVYETYRSLEKLASEELAVRIAGLRAPSTEDAS